MGQDHIEWVFDDAKATIISRGEERDQPDGERTIPRCVTAFNAITGHKLSNEDGWMFMEVLKQCRSVQGAYKYDDYRDRLGYAALAAEEARMTEEKRLSQVTCEAPTAEPPELPSHLCECLIWECPVRTGKPTKEGREWCWATVRRQLDANPELWDASMVPPECDNRGGA
jgi:hypothetical protein